MLIDSHVHCFPFLGGAGDEREIRRQLLCAQKLIGRHFEDTRRKSDGAVVSNHLLWDPERPGPEGRWDVCFRAGASGRYEWTLDDADYYKQYMPVSLRDMTAPAELLVAAMDYAGVDVGVIQRGHIYGEIDAFCERAVAAYPDRLIGLAQIDESRAYEEAQIARLHRAKDDFNLQGLYFEPGALFLAGFREAFDESSFRPFWQEVSDLGWPVFFQTERDMFADQMSTCNRVLERWPTMTWVISLGLALLAARPGSRTAIPDVIMDLVGQHDVLLEIAYPVSIGRDHDYPYPETHDTISLLYDSFGGGKLVWGSDMPNVERYCTYRQSLAYLRDGCHLIPADDLELILGSNMMRVFGLDSFREERR